MGLDNKGFKDLISLSEAEELFGISNAHLRRLAIQGKIGAKKIGRNWLTTKEFIQEYLNTRKPPGRPRKLD
jgi:excisionase family DNA binding protein